MNFIDLAAQRDRIRPEIDAAIARVVSTCGFIMGPEVTNFEKALATFAGAKHALACANGTDALLIPLRAWNIGPGDAVFVPSFTFVASAEVVPLVGASPVFVDVLPDTYNIDPASLEAAIEAVKKDGKLKPRAIIAVDLFGQPADYVAISVIARKHGLKLVADQAQGFGCTLNGKQPLDWADVATASFFPAKPLGCYGDGGAILTNDDSLAGLVDSIRIHGKASAEDMAAKKYDNDPRYLNMRIGVNSRLDAMQAAILSEKLKIYPDELQKRDTIAQRYNEGLAKHVRSVPAVIKGGFSNWAQYTIEHDNRDALAAHLKTKGVPTAIYYPIPIHMQDVYSVYPKAPGGLPVTEAIRNRVLSLPMHPYLSKADQDTIIEAIRGFNG
ncbi:MAG TPA: DegT/DnrJ/EryC1/StrS aminotransferase family protein [Hyphomonadaceae bacterium]|nr:DegT/DnrJ/EryC1/StrS aminotransferase family protein [Hyphomonadaceae bacterium]HPI46837.1 DegT/DnrJ/EryC1/StrS aminotransferase family protein [Hyphomonadaceae bacterium]